MKALCCPTCGQIRPEVYAEHLEVLTRLAGADDQEAVSIKRAAELLDISVTLLGKLIASGDVPVCAIHGRRVIRREALREYLRQIEVRSVRWPEQGEVEAFFAPGKTRGRQLTKR